MLQALLNTIKKHEGLELKPYKCTAGKWTIGYGRNLEDRGINALEAEYLLEHDVARVLGELSLNIIFWDELSDVRKVVLADMCFNLGINGLLRFKRMLKALEDRNYKKAVVEMFDSRWAKQVGKRATELANMMRDNKY